MKNLHLTLVPLGIALMAAGCGGGGGSSGGSGSVPTATVKITSTNSSKFASGAVSSTEQVTGSASTGNSNVGLKSIAQSATPNTLTAANIAAAQFNKVLKLPVLGTPVARSTRAPAPSNVTIYSCATGAEVLSAGTDTYTLTLNLAGAYLAAGDSFELSFNQCNDSGIIYDGSMSYAVTSLVNGSSAAYKTTFTAFSATEGTDVLSMAGDMTNSASLSGQVLTSAISGNSFSVSLNGDGFTMNAYSETYTYDVQTTAYSYAINMSLSMTTAGGVETVDVTTSPAFSGVGDANPTLGTMKISGTEGTYVSVSALNSTQATVVVNDGTNPVSTTPVLWTDL